jgi:predicted PurR-regulated permease PerM
MNLPPLGNPREWPPIVQALAWAALASAAALLIGAGLAQIAALISAQSALIAAVIAGWLLATLADAPIDVLARRGMARRHAVVVVWLLGAIPVLVIIAELVFALATSLGVVVSAAPPTSVEIGALVARPSGLLRSIGIDIDLVPIATEALTFIRSAAATVQANIANIAAGAVAALGPVILAIGLGVILSANPAYVGVLNIFLPRASEASVHRSREVLELILARFIGRHLLLGLTFGLAAGLGASLAGADAVLAGTLGGLVMAIPTIGQGAAVIPPLLLALLSAGDQTLLGIAVIVISWLLVATQLAPRLLNGVLRLSGATVFIAGTAGGLVAGIPGAIFALPVVAAVAALQRPESTRKSKGRASRGT